MPEVPEFVKNFKPTLVALVLGAGLILAGCGGKIKDSTPTVSHVWDARVGDPLCGDYSVSLLERKNPDNILEGFRAQASNTEGDKVDLIVNEAFDCGDGVRFTTLSLANNGKPAISGRISDYN